MTPFRKAALVLVSLGLAYFPLAASAQSITLPATIEANDAGFALLSSFGTTPGITGFSGSKRAIVTVSSGQVRLSTTSGLTAPTGYSAPAWTSSAAEIGFEGDAVDADAALATLAYRGSGGTLSVNVVPGGEAYNPDTGSFYEFVSTPLTRIGAESAAAARTLNGAAGYFATVTSAAELAFILDKVGVGTQDWLGGSDAALENEWRWVGSAGVPVSERGALFFTNDFTSNDAADFWCAIEPNDSGGNEDALQINFAGCWNDLPDNSTTIGYMVEYTPHRALSGPVHRERSRPT